MQCVCTTKPQRDVNTVAHTLQPSRTHTHTHCGCLLVLDVIIKNSVWLRRGVYLHSYMHMCTVPHKIFLFELLFEVRVENIELRLRSEFNESMCMSNRATVYFYFIFFFYMQM